MNAALAGESGPVDDIGTSRAHAYVFDFPALHLQLQTGWGGIVFVQNAT